jgi:hypothetical protein
MKSWIWLRAAAVLQALGTLGHTMATHSPSRGPEEQAVFDAMRAYHFTVMGASRSHFDFYKGYELSITVLFAVLAVLMWQLGNLSRSEPRHAMPLIVTILICQVLLDVVGWTNFFAGPGVMSILISLCLVAALFGMYRQDHAAPATMRQSKAG